MKLPAYPDTVPSGFQGLGKLPKHWTVTRGRFVMQVNPPAHRLRTLKPEDEVSFVPMEAVGEHGGLTLDQTRALADVSSGYTEFQDGDVVVAKITPCFENGKAALANALLNGAAYGTTELHVLRAGPTLNRCFLFYVAISDRFRKLGESEMYGAGGQKRVPPEFNKDFPMAVPTFTEQQQIAAFLDWKTGQIDALITRKQELLKKLKEKRLAIITHAVTRGLHPAAPLKDSGIPWLGQVPKKWTLNYKLGFISASDRNSFVNGPFGSDLLTSELVDDGVPVLYSGDVKATKFLRKSAKYVTEEKARELDFCRADAGDLLLAKVGDPPGDACVYPTGSPTAVVTQDVIRIKVDRDRADPEYLSLLLTSEMGRHLVKLVSIEATRGRFSLADLKNIRFPLPPLAEQEQIAKSITKALKRVDEMYEVNETAIALLAEYRTAIVTAATTGKIDVRNVKIPELVA